MNFVYPQFLWAFLILAIPVIIHLFNFKRYKTLYFSSLQFVKHVDQKTKSTQRLKHILILISRLLAFTFLILAFAQPYFGNDFTKYTGGNSIIAVYIDNSFSMEAQGTEGSLLSEAREKCREIIHKSNQKSKFLIATNEMTSSEEKLLTKAEAIDKLDKIELSPSIKSAAEILKWQEKTFDKLNEESERKSSIEYFVMSDFQQISQNKSIDLSAEAKITPIQFIPGSTSNISIDSVWFEDPTRKLNESNEINILLNNHSDEDLSNVETTIKIGGQNKTIFTDLAPNQKTTIKYSILNNKEEFKEGVATVADKSTHFDDSYYFSYEVTTSQQILILNGEDEVDNFDVIYSLDDYYQVKSINIKSVRLDDFNATNLVLLNGVNELSSGLASNLIDFIANGGSVAIFPGAKIEKTSINRLLQKYNLPQITGKTSSGTKITKYNTDDYFMKGLFNESPKMINLSGLNSVYANTRNGGINLVQLQNGQPLLSRADNNGKLFMFYAPLNPNNGNLINNIFTSSVVLRIGEVSNRNQPLSTTIGSTIGYPVYVSLKKDQTLKVRNNQGEFIPPQETRGGVTYISLNSSILNYNFTAGNHYIINKNDKVGVLSLNYNRIESELTSLNKNEIEAVFQPEKNEINVLQTSTERDLSTIDVNKPISYWRFCIILTLIFVAIEMLLIRFIK